jgi:hypothetical protein
MRSTWASRRTATACVSEGDPRSITLFTRASVGMSDIGPRTQPMRSPGHATLLSDPIVMMGASGA